MFVRNATKCHKVHLRDAVDTGSTNKSVERVTPNTDKDVLGNRLCKLVTVRPDQDLEEDLENSILFLFSVRFRRGPVHWIIKITIQSRQKVISQFVDHWGRL